MAVTTHSFKYKPTTAPSGTEDRVLACSHTTDDCHCVINASGQIGYYVSGVFTQIGTATVSLNEQYAFIIEHDDTGNGCIYLNGQKIGCATNFPTSAINQIGNFKTELKPETGRKPKVGLKPRAVSNIYTRPCCGVIDEYARFNRALSASEVVDLSQSGTLSKVYTLADYKITLMADDGIIATTEKPRYKENWRSIWNADQRTSALPTAIASITVNGSYKSLATAANDAGIWTPTTNGTPAYNYYQAVESWRQMYFVSSGGGNGFLLTANLAGDTDISAMSPTLEARQSALMYAEDALRSAIMTQRQSNAETNAIDTMTEYADDLEAALRLQTDHALVFTTSATDPSTSWTAEEKLIHKGDYWRVNSSSPWKTWSGTAWATVDDAQAQAAATAAASAASTAQTTANNAASVASSAQSTADDAQADATAALSTLSDIASDSKFTPVEKQSALNEWNIIAAEKSVNVSQATSFGISSTDYSNAFQALANYLNNGATWSSGTPAWLASLTTTQTIVGTDFRAAWKLYYDKRTDLLNSIAAKAKALADNAQTTANTKRRVFTATPTAPYDVGDLWVAGSAGDIKKCKTARATGSYTASEWEIASKYTDDTVAVTKSRTFIQATAPSTGVQAGDYWLDSDDNYKPYVYKSGAWSVDRAMESAINAQNTADSKTTLWATLAVANSDGAVAGDMFMDSSMIYRCLTSAPDIMIDNSTRITSKNFGNLASAPTGAIANDRYYNTTNLTWYRHTGLAWTADGEALNTVTVTYTPKYLGRYEGVHPASYNNGDWWLVYDTDDSPLVRGFWYSNNGTPARVSKLSTEAQRKYKGVGLEDVLYASNNGYALLSGVYDPVAVYGVSVMEYLAVNQAFIAKLMTKELKLVTDGVIYGGTRYNADGTIANRNVTGFHLDGDTGKFQGTIESDNVGNTFVGTNTGKYINAGTTVGGDGWYNTAVGYEAGKGTTSSNYYNNSFFGYNSGKANVTGNANSFFGSQSGEANVNGVGNSFFGCYSGQTNQGGSRNSFFGWESGLNNDGYANSFFGYGAGVSNSSGDSNCFFGNYSGSNATTQNNVVCVGYNTTINTSAGDYQINLNNRIRYFEFPSGTAYTAIYTAVSPYVAAYNQDGRGSTGVGAIGVYGHKPFYFIYRPNSTDLAFAEYGTEWLRISATVPGTTPYELKVEFISDA